MQVRFSHHACLWRATLTRLLPRPPPPPPPSPSPPVPRREKIDLSKRQLSEELLRDGGANLDGVECYDVTFVGADARVTVRCPKESYILDAGEAAGLELPSSCRGGICGACVGKVTRGSADQSDVSFISLTLHPYIAASPPGVEGTGPRRLCARPLTTSRSPNTVPTRRSPTCRSLWRTIRLRRA